MERDELLLKDYLLERFSRKFLLEKYHVVNDFNDFVNEILKHLNDYNDTYQYTGWNFSKDGCLCLFDETIKYPIFLKVIDDINYKNVMSITDRAESSNRILLTINNAKLSKKMINMQSILYHECRHCLEMYITDHNTIKDELTFTKKDKCLETLNKINKNRCLTIIDLFSDSEERARIDRTIHYLQLSCTKKYSTDDIQMLLEKSDEHSLISLMFEYLEIIKMHANIGIDDFAVPIYSAYLYKKYKCGQCNIDDIDIENIDDMKDDEKQKISLLFYQFIEKNIVDYLFKLHKAVLVHIIEKD